MKYTALLTISLIFYWSCQVKQSQPIKEGKTKLVVGIVVDQMRYGYLPRFYIK